LPYFSLLTNESILHISGPDSLKFLQGQTTCDTSVVDATHATIGAFCTPQGRVVCDFSLAQLAGEHFAMRMRRDIRERAAEVFGKYIVFSKAELDAKRDDWLVLGAWGEGIEESLQAVFEDIPGERWTSVSGTGFTLIRTSQSEPHFEIYLSTDSEKLSQLKNNSDQCDETLWQREQISAGIARIEAATVETLVPQVLNYDLTGHISFSKGCYTGQEVVARLHYRGKSKRRTYQAILPQPANAGDSLFSEGGQQSVGNVINTAGGENILALVCATEDAIQKGLRLDSAEGPLTTLIPLPYALGSD
jgi:folate-binding protein YgfZ